MCYALGLIPNENSQSLVIAKRTDLKVVYCSKWRDGGNKIFQINPHMCLCQNFNSKWGPREGNYSSVTRNLIGVAS